jgi:hypothetical protein
LHEDLRGSYRQAGNEDMWREPTGPASRKALEEVRGLCFDKKNLVLKILSDMTQNIVQKAEELAAEFYDNYGTDGIIERICSVIRKKAHKIG